MLRRLWPVPVVIAASIAIQKVAFESDYDVGGHAAGHLSSATAPFLGGAVVILLLWATPAARRQLDVIAACAAWLTATVFVLIGNVRVVDDLIAAGLGHAPTEGLPDVADHGLANSAPWFAVIAAVVLVGVMWRRGHISRPVAIGAAVLSVIFPPWVIPGAGAVVVAIARVVAVARTPAS